MAVIEGRERHIFGGVDTHKDLHVAAVVDEQDRILGTRSFPTTRQGYRQMLSWMLSFGELQRIGIEFYRQLRRRACALCSRQRSWSSRSRPPTSRIDGGEERTTISTLRTRPMPPLQASGP